MGGGSNRPERTYIKRIVLIRIGMSSKGLPKFPEVPTGRIYMKDEDRFIDYITKVLTIRKYKAPKILYDFLIKVWTESLGSYMRDTLKSHIDRLRESVSDDKIINAIKFLNEKKALLFPREVNPDKKLKDMLYDMLLGYEPGKPNELGERLAKLKYTRKRKSRKSRRGASRRMRH